MQLQDLLLKKEEHPILYETEFYLPIHPTLLNPEAEIPQEITRTTFIQAAKEWKADLNKYMKAEQDPELREWYKECFLDSCGKIEERQGRQYFLEGCWEDNVSFEENGFARSFSINRNHGGSLIFNPSVLDSSAVVPSRYMNFSKEKARAFSCEDTSKYESPWKVFTYSHHNIDHFPGALFLRNWGLLYLNEAMRSIEKHINQPQ